jgi:hypothetical protein
MRRHLLICGTAMPCLAGAAFADVGTATVARGLVTRPWRDTRSIQACRVA